MTMYNDAERAIDTKKGKVMYGDLPVLVDESARHLICR